MSRTRGITLLQSPRWTMARPRPEFPPRDAILALVDAEGRLALRVTPGARIESVEIGEGKLLIKVRTKPEDGKANAAVLGLLSQALEMAPSRFHLLRGATGREKLVRLEL